MYRPRDTLDIYGGGSDSSRRGPSPQQQHESGGGGRGRPTPAAPYGGSSEAKSPYSGVNIVQPPGGKTTLNVMGGSDPSWGADQPGRPTGSPRFGRRAQKELASGYGAHYTQPPQGANGHSYSETGQHDDRNPQGRYQHGSVDNVHQPPQGRSNGYGPPGYQPQHQSSPSYSSSLRAEGHYGAPSQYHKQANGSPRNNFSHQEPGYGRHVAGGRDVGSDVYHQPAMGGKNIVQPPGGSSSISFGGYDSPPAARAPPRSRGRPDSNGTHAQQSPSWQHDSNQQYNRHGGERVVGAEYHQPAMGGKNIVQPPGGSSSISFGGYDSAVRAPPPVRTRQESHGYDSQQPGRQPYGGPHHGDELNPVTNYDARSVPVPVQAAQRSQGQYASYSGMNIVQPPGGHTSFNIFG